MKSAVTLFRKKILGPGKTEHNGRGLYIMETDRRIEELLRKASEFSVKNPDLVESFDIKRDLSFTLVIAKAYGDPYYRTLEVSGIKDRNGPRIDAVVPFTL